MTKTVILAVNDPHILYLLQRYAEESGYRTVSARPGQDLVPLLADQTDPALMILDIEWPGIAVRNTARRLKTAASAHHVPLIIYSGLDEPEAEWHEGVAGHLPKSLLYDDFVATLQCVSASAEPAWSQGGQGLAGPA